MLGLYRKLKRAGVMSINQRNADFVLKYNARKRFPLVDDKLKSKTLAIEAGVSVPPLYRVIEQERELKDLDVILSPFTDFVIKPAQGAGGDGIIVIKDRVLGQQFRQMNGKILNIEHLQHHLSLMLSGAFSLSGHADKILIEHRVVVDRVFEAVTYEGIPDIRVIVLLGYPVMAMVRLPTRESSGKANLHQGAIGVGVDIGTGLTLGGVHLNHKIDYHPDTLEPIVNIQVPHWDKILNIAANCYELTGLGYLGVDIVLDRTHGPLMLEMNARPGLNIQLANREGALHRYRVIEAHAKRKSLSPQARVAFCKEKFAKGLLHDVNLHRTAEQEEVCL